MKYINKSDIHMILLVPLIFALQEAFRLSFSIELFNNYSAMFLCACYGGYIVLRLFTTVQQKNAVKKNLVRELEDINKIGDKDWRDKPRWIK